MNQLSGRAVRWWLGWVVLGSTLLYLAAPPSNRDGFWTHNVLRNWEQFGFFRLHGRLVTNPGGHGAIERPELYTGHRPASLYPAFAMGHISGGAGKSGLPFQLALVLLVASSTWLLLKKDCFAAAAAAAVAFSPGYIRSNLIIDPLAVPVWIGLAVMVALIRLLAAPRLTVGAAFGAAVLLALYASLNWATVFAFALLFAYLIAAPGTDRRRILLFLGMATLSISLVTAVSVLDKMGAPAVAGKPAVERVREFYNAYLTGPGGYMNFPMTWLKAFVRIVAASAVGMLPLTVLFAWRFYYSCRTCVEGMPDPAGRPPSSNSATIRRARGSGLRRCTLTLLPLGTAIVSIAGMRNYFAHHPWMAAPVLMVGMILSLRLLHEIESLADASSPAPRFHARGVFLVSAGSLTYSYAILLLLRTNVAQEEMLRTLVQSHSLRSEILVISPENDATLAREAYRLEALFDRRIVVPGQFNTNVTGTADRRLILTAVPPGATHTLVAESSNQSSGVRRTSDQLLKWYRATIARREKGDRIEAEARYYLVESRQP